VPNDGVSGTAVPSFNIAGDATLPDQPPRLAHGEAVSAARTVRPHPRLCLTGTAYRPGQKTLWT